MNVFSTITSVQPFDCIRADDEMIFVVNQGQMGLAIGRGGINVKTLERLLKKSIIIVEYFDDPVKLLEGIFKPKKMLSGYVSTTDGSKTVEVSVDGRINLDKIKLGKLLIQRYFNIASINIR